MGRIFKKFEDLYIFASLIEIFFVREYAFGGFYLQICINQIICRCSSMRVYIILKCLAKHHMPHVSKIQGPPPPNNTVHVFLFFFILLNFKKANILHNYLIYPYSMIANIYFKQILIYYQDIQYIVILQILIFLIQNVCHIQI